MLGNIVKFIYKFFKLDYAKITICTKITICKTLRFNDLRNVCILTAYNNDDGLEFVLIFYISNFDFSKRDLFMFNMLETIERDFFHYFSFLFLIFS